MLIHRALRGLIAAAGAALVLTKADARVEPSFRSAKPIWPAGRSLEKNLQVGFRAIVDTERPRNTKLRLTASTLYRATVNGRHAGYGPARGPHGYYRIDEWDITRLLRPGRNIIAVEVAGYNVNSYYTLDQPSFLQAELLEGSAVLAATGVSGFDAIILADRVQKVQRYSFQRPFTEVYRLNFDSERWKVDADAPLTRAECEVLPDGRRYLDRRVGYPEFNRKPVKELIARGRLEPANPARLWKDRSLTAIGPALKGYPEAELEALPSIDMQKVASRTGSEPARSLGTTDSISLGASQYAILDLGVNLTGFIGATVTCREPTTLVFAFDEVLRDGDVDWKRLGCVNLVHYDLSPGTYALESFEPYTLRYIKPMVTRGQCVISGVYLREYAAPGVEGAQFRSSDPRLERLFEAGRETFRQNAVDVLTDCPSRERAGWLCDSFFTARSALDLTGNTITEAVQMEDLLKPARFDFLPPGMIPMCYPADHNDGVYIPNWALWFVVQLEEYQKRSGDRETVEAFRNRVFGLFDYLKQYRNLDGLLEKLPGWVFIEWSDANKYVQDVNYPTNMVYAGALAAAGRLYQRQDFSAEADRIRDVIRKQAFDGKFFVDNAVRRPDGNLEVTRNRTEVCQYYAFFFDIASPRSHTELWDILRTKFGPKRSESRAFPEIGAANSFIGNMLRVELLSRVGAAQQILDESIDYLLYMAERTGTLWENVGDYASCNHGFASHVVHTLFRDILGARDIDRAGKSLKLVIPDTKLSWCEGLIPTAAGPVRISWKRDGQKVEYKLSAPRGYKVKVEGAPGLELHRR